MVDIFNLYKLGITAGKVLKASKGVYDAGVIFKTVRKPLVVLGISGFMDGAVEEALDKLEEIKGE